MKLKWNNAALNMAISSRFAITRGLWIRLSVATLILAASASASSLPFTETFEIANGVTNGSLEGQDGWMISSGSNATVLAGGATNSSAALAIQNSQVTHYLTNTEKSVWISFYHMIANNPTSNNIATNANTSAAFYVNSSRYLVVYNGTNPVTLSTRLTRSVWYRFDVFCDYTTAKWLLNINGTNVANNLAFYSTNRARMGSIQIANDNTTGFKFDELIVQDTEPLSGLSDRDGDGLPDWWEQRYFSSITNATTNSISANGSTCLYSYIAGLDPTNETDCLHLIQAVGLKINWDRKLARNYDVYWASNLLSGFTFIQTAAGNEFEDTNTNRTKMPTSFYQIRVRK